jgi:hypothetical protein
MVLLLPSMIRVFFARHLKLCNLSIRTDWTTSADPSQGLGLTQGLV